MDSANALHQLRKSPFAMPDPGDAGLMIPDRDFAYFPLVSGSSAETRTLLGPLKAGLDCRIGMTTDGGGAITVTAYDSAGSASGTVIFNDAADWAMLVSVETSAGVFAWRMIATYGTSGTLPTATTNTTATGVTYAGATGENILDFPTNLAEGLIIQDSAAVVFAVLVSTTGSPLWSLPANVSLANATTPYLETASGKTNTGYLQVKGKTSGALKLSCADATAYTLTLSAAAQTVGAATLTLPDCANTASWLVVSTSSTTYTLPQAIVVAQATTPSITTTYGKTNTGFVKVCGKTGTDKGVKLTCADNMGNNLIVSAAAVASADRTVTLPDPGGADSVAYLALAQTLSAKTLAAPIFTGTQRNSNTTTPVAAAGSVVGDAGALPDTYISHVTTDSAAKGVVLPAVTAGGVVRIVINDTAGTALKIYAESTGTINGGSADAAYVIAANKGVLCISSAAKTWIVFDLPAKASAA